MTDNITLWVALLSCSDALLRRLFSCRLVQDKDSLLAGIELRRSRPGNITALRKSHRDPFLQLATLLYTLDVNNSLIPFWGMFADASRRISLCRFALAASSGGFPR